jgi:hypothetical protein
MVRLQTRERIAVQRPGNVSSRKRRKDHQLGGCAPYCILRVAGALGEPKPWVVHIVPARGGYASHIAFADRGVMIAEQGSGQDGTLATWDAMCRVEQRMRQRGG